MCDIKDVAKHGLTAVGVGTLPGVFADEIGDFVSDPFGSKKAAKKAKQQAADAKNQALADEEARKAAIAQGNANIDRAFGQFDDNYFGNYKSAYRGFYNPQIDDQYNDNVGRLMSALAGRGQLGGTVGNRAFGDMQERYSDERARIGNDAESAASDLRGRIEGQKTGLYASNQAAANPEGINARARAEATSLTAPPTYSRLGDVFRDLVDPFMNYYKSYQYAAPQPYRPAYATDNGGSGRIVK